MTYIFGIFTLPHARVFTKLSPADNQLQRAPFLAGSPGSTNLRLFVQSRFPTLRPTNASPPTTHFNLITSSSPKISAQPRRLSPASAVTLFKILLCWQSYQQRIAAEEESSSAQPYHPATRLYPASTYTNKHSNSRDFPSQPQQQSRVFCAWRRGVLGFLTETVQRLPWREPDTSVCCWG